MTFDNDLIFFSQKIKYELWQNQRTAAHLKVAYHMFKVGTKAFLGN